MQKCKSQKRCWFPRKSNSNYCYSCEKEKDLAFIENNITKIPLILSSNEFCRVLHHNDILDRIFKEMYTNHKEYLKTYITNITGTFMENILILRIKNHVSTDLCPVIAWMLRLKIYPEEIMPEKCFKCCSHILRHSQINRNLIFYTFRFNPYELRNEFRMKELIKKNENNDSILKEFAYAILETEGNAFIYNDYMKSIKEYIKGNSQELENYILLHNTEFSLENKESIYSICVKRMSIIKDELLAVSMHPSRVFHWCISEDSKKMHNLPDYVFSEGRAPWTLIESF